MILMPVTNVIESSFATNRHRTVRSKGCLSNKTALGMIFKLVRPLKKTGVFLTVTTVAESNPRGKVYWHTGGRQIANASRCRLTPCVSRSAIASSASGQ